MPTYKSFADLATAMGPVMPSTKELEAEYGPAIDPIPTKAPEGPKVWKRYVLPEEDPTDYTDSFWLKWQNDFTNWLASGATFFDFDERSQYDPIQFVDKVAQGIERMRDTCEDAGRHTKAEIAEFDRRDSGTEIDIERYRMLNERLRLLRLKWYRANKAFDAAMGARNRIVSQAMTGHRGLKNVEPYMSMERLAGLQRSKVQREKREFKAMIEAEKLLGLSETEFRARQNRARQQLLDTTMSTLGGIDADDGNGAGRSKIEGRPSPSQAVVEAETPSHIRH
jgi:hypothetical protein